MSCSPQRSSAPYSASRQGFEPIPKSQAGSTRPGDATIDHPLDEMPIQSPTGQRGDDSYAPLTAPLNPPTHQLTHGSSVARKRKSGGRRMVKIDSKGQGTGKIGYDGEEDTINKMGRMYLRVRDYSILTRYIVYVAPLALCIAVPIVIGASVSKNARLGGVKIVWFFTWIEIVWLSLWVSKFVAHCLPFVFKFGAGFVGPGTRKYYMVLQALEIPLSLVGWALTSLSTFAPIMTRNPDARARKDTGLQDWEKIMNEILAATLCSTLVLLLEKALIQVISIDYHRTQLNNKIQASKRNVHLLGLMYEASRRMFPLYCPEFAEEDYAIADQLNLARALGSKAKSHRRSGSMTPARIIQDVGRFGDKVTSAFGNVAHEITGKQVFNPHSSQSIVAGALNKKRTSEALAKRIWMSFVIEGKEALYHDDIEDVLGESHREEAEEAFVALDRDANGDISLDEMIFVVTQWSRERKAVANSMHDVDEAINVLDRMLMVAVFVVVIFIFIAFLNKSFLSTLATAGTALISLSFVFSVTCQEVLGSCIFLFVKHPFDIGDRVDIALDQLSVDHISLLFTVFRRASGLHTGRLVQIPNNVLNTLWIENVTRSKAMKEQMSLMVSFDTSFDDITALRHELITFVTDKDNSRDFLPDLDVEVLGTSDMSKLELRIEMRTKVNWANETQRAAKRSKFMCALVQALRRVPINGPGSGEDPVGSAANANYSVTISDEVAKKNATEAAEAKEAARLVKAKNEIPQSPIKSGSGDVPPLGLTVNQEKIIDNLNSRPPTSDAPQVETWGASSSQDDTITLGERPSIDRQDLEEVKGLLHRESTRGKRRPGTQRMLSPNIPTINEPQSAIGRTDFARQPEASLDVDRQEQSQMLAQGLDVPSLGSPLPPSPSAYVNTDEDTSYMSPYSRAQAQGQQVEMRDLSRSPSMPYRQRRGSSSSNQPGPSTYLQGGQYGGARVYEDV